MNNGLFGVPGQSAAAFAEQREIFWGGGEDKIEILRTSATIDSSARDAGNTPTTVLRAGLLLGKVTASGKLKQYDPDGLDGTETVYGVLLAETRMTDELGVAVDRYVPVVVSAPVKASKLLIEGAAYDGNAGEADAKADLEAKFFRIDKELC